MAYSLTNTKKSPENKPSIKIGICFGFFPCIKAPYIQIGLGHKILTLWCSFNNKNKTTKQPITIPKDQLLHGHYYIGDGRFVGETQVAMWNERIEQFIGLGYSYGFWEGNKADYGERGFSPYKLIE